MATVTVTIPDNLVDDLSVALAREMGVPVPTTAAAKQQLAQDFMKKKAKDALINYRMQSAAQTAAANQSDPAVTW